MNIETVNNINVNNLDEVKKTHAKCLDKLRALIISGRSNPNLSRKVVELEKIIKEAETVEPHPISRINLEKYMNRPRISVK